MSVIEQYGLELNELDAQLQKFLGVSVPCNEDLQDKRGRLGTGAEAVATASAGYKDALVALDNSLADLGTGANSGWTKYDETARLAQDRLGSASLALDESEQIALTQMRATSEENKKTLGGLGEEERQATESFGLTSKAISGPSGVLQGMRDLGLACTAAYAADVDSIRDQTRVIGEHGQQTSAQLDAHRTGVDRYVSGDLKSEFKRFSDWLDTEVNGSHASSLRLAGTAAEGAFTTFQRAVSTHVGQVVEGVNGAFGDASRAITDSQQRVSDRVNLQTQDLLNRLLAKQQDVSLSFDPGLATAIQCSENFAKLKQNLEIIRKSGYYD